MYIQYTHSVHMSYIACVASELTRMRHRLVLHDCTLYIHIEEKIYHYSLVKKNLPTVVNYNN